MYIKHYFIIISVVKVRLGWGRWGRQDCRRKVVGVVGEVGVFLGLVGLVFVEIVGESGLWVG